MKRLLIAGLLAPVLGAGACGNNYGVSSGAPLGDFKTIDTLLTGKKLAKESDEIHLKHMDHDPTSEPSGLASDGGVRHSYIDKARVGALHVAYVHVDGNEKVAGVGGEFRSDARGFDYGVYKITRFIADYWVTIAGAPPEFSPTRVKHGMIGKEMLLATFDNGQFKGRWVKHVIGGGMRDKILDQVIICYK